MRLVVRSGRLQDYLFLVVEARLARCIPYMQKKEELQMLSTIERLSKAICHYLHLHPNKRLFHEDLEISAECGSFTLPLPNYVAPLTALPPFAETNGAGSAFLIISERTFEPRMLQIIRLCAVPKLMASHEASKNLGLLQSFVLSTESSRTYPG
jgi:hypothetical protein